MTKKASLILFAVLAVGSGIAFAKRDAAGGSGKAITCLACHGAAGMSTYELIPNLAGQKQPYLVKQLKAFRDGTRKDPVMSQVAKSLSNAEIDSLATFFSTQDAGAAIAAQNAAAAVTSRHAPIIVSPMVVPRPHPTRQYWAALLPQGEGRAVVQQKCQLCHELQKALVHARPKAQWRGIVEAMRRRGSPITAEELPVVVNYLTEYFGPESPPIIGASGKVELGMKPCKRSEWPRGSSNFRSNWKGSYNIWLSNQLGGNIYVVDPITRKIVSTIECISSPDRVEFSRNGNRAYVPDRVEHNVTVINTRTGAIVKKIPLIDRPNVAVLSRDYKTLYSGIWPLTGDEDKRGYIQVIDTTTLRVTKTIEVKGGLHDLWMSPDGKLLLAMSPPGLFMDLFDTEDDHLIWTCCREAEIGTMNIEAGPDGTTGRIFFSYSGFPGIVVADPKTGRELQRIEYPVVNGLRHTGQTTKAFGFHGGEISPDGKTYWVMAGSYVYEYSLPGLKYLGGVQLALIDQAGKPFTPAVEGSWLTISPDGRKVYAVRPGRNLLSVIDVKTMTEEALIPTGEYPLHISIWPRGTP